MNKYILMLCCALALPVVAQANVSLNVDLPGASIHIGDKNDRGYYWDGYDWRPPQWWHDHQGKHMGERNSHGLYWHGNRWEAAPPPKHQPPRQPRGEPNHGNHDPHGNQGKGDQDHGNQGHGEPLPPDAQHH